MNVFKHFNLGSHDNNSNDTTSSSTTKDSSTGKTLVINGVEVRILKKIGEGGYSFVFLVQETMSERKYALKRCIAVDLEAVNNIEEEISVMKTLTQLKHPNLMQYISHTMKNGKNGTKEYYILTEFCSNGSLINEIQGCLDRGILYSEIKMVIALECIFKGLHAMHTLPQPISHRDIKLENVLIDSQGNYKLCDFGSTSKDNQIFTTSAEMQKQELIIQKRSTEMYRSPELCDLYRAKNNNWPICPKVDIWAVGNILYTLAYHTHPFEDGGYMAILSGRIVWPNQTKGSKFEKTYSPWVNYIISKCFTMNPNNRPSAQHMIYLLSCWKYYLQNKCTFNDVKVQEEIRTWIPRIITDANLSITTETLQQNTTNNTNANNTTPQRAKKQQDLQEELRRLEQEALERVSQEEGRLRTQQQQNRLQQNSGQQHSSLLSPNHLQQHHSQQQQPRQLTRGVNNNQQSIHRNNPGQILKPQQPQSNSHFSSQQQQQQQSQLQQSQPSKQPPRPQRPGSKNQPNNNNQDDEWGNIAFEVNFDDFVDENNNNNNNNTLNNSSTPILPTQSLTPSTSISSNQPQQSFQHSQSFSQQQQSQPQLLQPPQTTRLPSTPSRSGTTLPSQLSIQKPSRPALQQTPSQQQQQQTTQQPSKSQTTTTLDDWGDFALEFDSFIDPPSQTSPQQPQTQLTQQFSNISSHQPTPNTNNQSQQQQQQKSPNPNGDIFDSFDFSSSSFVSQQQSSISTPSQNHSQSNNNNNNNNNSKVDDFTRLHYSASSQQHQQMIPPQPPSYGFSPYPTQPLPQQPNQVFFQQSPPQQQQQYNPYLVASQPHMMPSNQSSQSRNSNNNNQPDFLSGNF